MRGRIGPFSRATKTVIGLGVILVVVAVSGVFRPEQSLEVTRDEAIEIAEARIDFEPELTTARVVRQGFGAVPFWAVSFSIPDGDGDGFARVTTVLVNAVDGEVGDVREGG